MYTINFNDYDHNFCESSIYSPYPHPEYMNSVSSLFITFIGLNGLTKPYLNFQLITLYSALTVNGITSCIYHYCNSIGWGLLDRMSMIIIAMTSINLLINNINYFLINDYYDKYKYINIINRTSSIIVVSFFTFLFTISGLHNEKLFNILFGLYLFGLFIFILLINKNYNKLDIPYNIVVLGNKGIIYIIVSGLFWIITEKLCNKLFFIKYLFGHVLWHLFVSYGGYLVSLIFCYMYMQETQNKNMQGIIINYDYFKIPYLIFDKKYNIHVSRV